MNRRRAPQGEHHSQQAGSFRRGDHPRPRQDPGADPCAKGAPRASGMGRVHGHQARAGSAGVGPGQGPQAPPVYSAVASFLGSVCRRVCSSRHFLCFGGCEIRRFPTVQPELYCRCHGSSCSKHARPACDPASGRQGGTDPPIRVSKDAAEPQCVPASSLAGLRPQKVTRPT